MFVDTVVLAGVGTVLLMVAFFGGLVTSSGRMRTSASRADPSSSLGTQGNSGDLGRPFYLRLARLRSQHLLDINT